jgi:hypothetical protein
MRGNHYFSVDDFAQQNSYHRHEDMQDMLGQNTGFGIIAILLAASCVAQEAPQESLGDIARRERARKEAARAAAGPELGTPPPIVADNEIVPAHFLMVNGNVAPGEFLVLVNGQPVIHNTGVPQLPPYITGLLRDGGNILAIQFTSAPDKPLDIVIEERFPNEHTHATLVHFHANANQFPAATTRQVAFTAHPKLLPPIQLTDADRKAIFNLVQNFYDTLSRKDGTAVLALFAPALAEVRTVFPEGADFGQNAMRDLASFATHPEITMQPYDPAGVEIVANRRVVSVRRTDGQPVFTSSEVPSANAGGGASRVSADVILAKKIKGEWRLTLPFGF